MLDCSPTDPMKPFEYERPKRLQNSTDSHEVPKKTTESIPNEHSSRVTRQEDRSDCDVDKIEQWRRIMELDPQSREGLINALARKSTEAIFPFSF
jgi:hypothetical protein